MVVLGRSAEPMGAHWDGKIANEWNIRTETRRAIIKLKQVRNFDASVVRQVMQTVNCAPARRLKMFWWITLVSLQEHTRME